MYHPYPSKNSILPARAAFPPERHLLLQGGNVQGDSGLILSTDAKPRLKWTPELHERFIEAVNQLGGAEKATPKTVMKLMGIPGLTLYHLKSHLQKHRLSKNLHAQSCSGATKNVIGCTVATDKASEVTGSLMSKTNIPAQTNNSMQISEALQIQIEVQKRLHEQLEVQRHLQLRIEAQGKYLQCVLEKAQETLGKQNLGPQSLEAAKAQISELVSRVSNESLGTAFPGFKDLPLETLQAQMAQLADFSMDSCLTSVEGSQKDQEVHNLDTGLRIHQARTPQCFGENIKLEQPNNAWDGNTTVHDIVPSTKLRDSSMTIFPVKMTATSPTISFKTKSEKEGNNSISNAWHKERGLDDLSHYEQPLRDRPVMQQEKQRQSDAYGLPCQTAQLDLNVGDDNLSLSDCKQFDLNDFSWS
ncbi:myb-related protein 2-like [Dioscorea cayenensis subsp. rotundata]|uniref:Myb-related protein 2-like n=1 Tax=Dioscorea cayennensis subsp. rotundata TaxID=55577 RepID=A0AB40C1K0_DIOCR|nr:myb-related protein 2-like [Dioscorea cayenensis subsp. rotundata]XP_039132677.1 myb-related protein 2-like [Dioscorea cayenensis subsp. rotundata]